LNRETISHLEVWDVAARENVLLEAGLPVSVLRLRCEPPGGASGTPYLTEFECRGRVYTCPLYSFQARTQTARMDFAATEQQRTVAVG